MPTYVYKFVETGETIEVQQSFTDETLTEYVHPDSGDVMAVKKVFQPVGVTFRGSGFFKTDSRGSKETSRSGSSSDGTSSSSSSRESKDASGSTGSDGSSGSTGATTSPSPGSTSD